MRAWRPLLLGALVGTIFGAVVCSHMPISSKGVLIATDLCLALVYLCVGREDD